MTEAIVDIRGCDFTNLNLSGKVLSGVLMQVGGMLDGVGWAGWVGRPVGAVDSGRRQLPLTPLPS